MIGDIIRNLRNEAGYTQFELAEKLNISASAIGMYENNRRLPDINNIIQMSNIFNVSTDYILGIETTTNDNKLDIKHKPVLDAMHDSFFENFTKLYSKNNLDFENEERILGLTHKQINDMRTVRLPNLIELKLLSDAFHVSINYLLGLPEYDLADEDKELLEYYNLLDKADRRLIMGNMVALMKQYHSNKSDIMVAEHILYNDLTKQIFHVTTENKVDSK